MTEYKNLYFFLFNSITDVLEQLEKQNFGTAADLLKAAQRKAEEAYISGSSPKMDRT